MCMCSMSARWLLCNSCSTCCKQSEGPNRRPAHTYCGCKETKGAKMPTHESSTADADKQILIGEEAVNYESIDRNKKENWEFEDPAVPFQNEFCDKLEASRDIIIHGTVLQNALHFTVNLCKGTGVDADIGLHLNPRFDQFYMPRNSRIHNTWKYEEGQASCKFPFRRGNQFFLEIFLTHNEFLVAVNGLHYCAFNYRYPLLELDTLEIFGHVRLHRVKFSVSNKYPMKLPETCDIERSHNFTIPECLPNKYTLSLNTIDTPHIFGLTDKLSIGNEIEICGRVKMLPHSFYINLQQGTQIWPHPTINLHLNVRFKQMTSTTRSVLANAWVKGGWGSEEFASENVIFLPGHKFVLQILCTTDAFHIFHDCKPILVFQHRTNISEIDTIYIVGDIAVSEISYS